ncbi:MAG: DUF4097 family beta strand repeat protein [Fidelibacterota bacterium]|nr:MAG: DUF4097 family beta strand repeat protein [Candidatus Neomarinimicrobiota bacterium]
MKHLLRNAVFALIFIALLSAPLYAQEEAISKTFKNINQLDVRIVSGDCIIEAGKGNEVTVDLVYDYSPDCFEPEFSADGNRLRLRERFERYRNCSGYSEWTITVPKGIDIDFSSASGDLSLTGCEGEYFLESASGRIEIESCQGEFEIENASGRVEIMDSDGEFSIDNASGRIRMEDVSGRFELDNASGNIDVVNVRGEFEVDNASGDIEAVEILIEDESNFDTASGDVIITLAKSPEHDVALESASGDVVLNYGGNKVVGFFEFTARADRGRIISPYKFDVEEEYERGNRVYERKSFTRGKGEPEILLRTSSGRAELELK